MSEQESPAEEKPKAVAKAPETGSDEGAAPNAADAVDAAPEAKVAEEAPKAEPVAEAVEAAKPDAPVVEAAKPATEEPKAIASGHAAAVDAHDAHGAHDAHDAHDAHGAHGHDPLEADRPPTGAIAVMVAVTIVVVIGICIGVNELFKVQVDEAKHAQFLDHESSTLRALRATEQERLNHYRWADQKAGVVRIPVDRAVELTLADYRKPAPPPAPPTVAPPVPPTEAPAVPPTVAPTDPKPAPEKAPAPHR